MKDIASHILDITENSVRAKASMVEIAVVIDEGADALAFTISDNGTGMSRKQIEQLTNPFYTTRNTRKVGLGIPLLVQNCQLTGGDVTIQSMPGSGTTLKATFGLTHIDRPPEGDIADVFVNIATGYPSVDFKFNYQTVKGIFDLDSREIKTMFEPLPINDLDVVTGLKEIVTSNIKELKTRTELNVRKV